MRYKRFIPLLFATFVCLFVSLYILQRLGEGRPQPSAWGERLNFSELRPNEEIAVECQLIGCRSEWSVRKYYVTGDAPGRFQALPSSGSRVTPDEQESVTRLLTLTEAEGLDATLRFFRSQKAEVSSGTKLNTFSYFRSGQKIGEEVFVGHWGLEKLNYLYAHRRDKDPDREEAYWEISRNYGLTRADLSKLLTLEMLAVHESGNTPNATADKER